MKIILVVMLPIALESGTLSLSLSFTYIRRVRSIRLAPKNTLSIDQRGERGDID